MNRRNRAIKKITNDLEKLRINGQDDVATDKVEASATYTHEMAENILASQPDKQKIPKKRCHIKLFVWLCLPFILVTDVAILGESMGLADKYVWQVVWQALAAMEHSLIIGIMISIFVTVVVIIIMSIDNH